ncbi:MAG: hypothetical protein JOZ69_23520 [Myxococcales bacterium]|nr:hypothetical protein [Myxococcales bacterium]
MPTPSPTQRPPRALALLPLAVAGLSAVLAGQLIGRDPRSAIPLLACTALLFLPALLGRWRMRRLLLSGDVERVIGTWEGSLARIPHAETIAPLLRATAYAAYGCIEPARRALARAGRGPAWDASIEQRLFVETLLDTFEGEREVAMRKADTLQALPMPRSGFLARRRVGLLRRGLAALARAFAHQSREGDAKLLGRAAGVSPLVHWAMRYAEAVVAVDRGRAKDVASLLAGAPAWPAGSAFHEYHAELLGRAGGGALGAGAGAGA